MLTGETPERCSADRRPALLRRRSGGAPPRKDSRVTPSWYTCPAVPTSHPRVQLTVDPELAAELDAIDPQPPSKARLIRDLALRGAREERAEQQRYDEALDHLRGIANGEVDYDFEAAERALADRDPSTGR